MEYLKSCKTEQTTAKKSRQKDIIKIRGEINKGEMKKKQYKNINETELVLWKDWQNFGEINQKKARIQINKIMRLKVRH